MSSARATRSVRVERHYKADDKLCAHAIKLLMEKAAGTSGGVDAKGSKIDRARYQYTR